MRIKRNRWITGIVLLATGLIGFGHWTCVPMSAQETAPTNGRIETAIFSGGCFWCMEPPFEKLPGVINVESGYTGGKKPNPTYEEVSHTNTGHVEAVRITFDANQIRYTDLLEVLWRNINPTDANGQFVDQGPSYLSGIFVLNDEQRAAAEASKKALAESKRFKRDIVTPIRDAGPFYLAEAYHQDYYKKNPIKYHYYRYRSGRDKFLNAKWGRDREYKITPLSQDEKSMPASTEGAASSVTRVGATSPAAPKQYTKPDITEIKKKLTPLQFKVTQRNGTEKAFKNEYWNNARAGIYVDIVSGEPLFSSRDKFKSGTGWPSFVRPLVPTNIVQKRDTRGFFLRMEVRSKHGDSHLGHVFNDGPAPTGLRFCINSASLKFIPAESLEAEGYGEYLRLFQPN